MTLCEYKGIVVPADEYTPTDSELESEVQSVLESYKENIKVTDRAVRDGDTVNIDYVGSVDGVEFEGGNTKGAGTDVTIGVTNYIDDFLEQLIGHKPGETFNVEVTFPDPYPNNTELSGKDAVFVTTVNHISEEKYPELTDSFVAEKFADEGWKTVAELRAGTFRGACGAKNVRIPPEIHHGAISDNRGAGKRNKAAGERDAQLLFLIRGSVFDDA